MTFFSFIPLALAMGVPSMRIVRWQTVYTLAAAKGALWRVTTALWSKEQAVQVVAFVDSLSILQFAHIRGLGRR